MRVLSKIAAATSLMVIVAGWSAPVEAASQQTANDPAAAASTTPSVTTATYGSWVLRCVATDKSGQPQQAASTDASAKGGKTCEVVQTVQVQGQNQPVAEVAIGRLGADQALVMTAVLPSNISIPGAVRIATDAKEGSDNKAGFDMVWTRCAGGACFATAKPDADSLSKMRSSKAGSVGFVDASGRGLAVPLSWVGLDQALTALDAQK